MVDAAKVVADDAFSQAATTTENLQDLGLRVLRGVQYIAELEARLKEAKAKLRELQEEKLPDAMLAEGIREFQVQGNNVIAGIVRLDNSIHARIPKYRRNEAVSYLRDKTYKNDKGKDVACGDELIKTAVTVLFLKGEHSEAKEFANGLKNDGFTVEVGETIHGSTFKSWARKIVPFAPQLDLDLLGIYIGQKAIVVGQELKEEEEEASGD